MAFHFNWSPLIADTDRVRHMLTSSLNKSPKPPIIVDDIIVNELNLGSNPPSLEILEIGDLAEDRFRGIFKVKYTGDAYLTLQTRVQANPLNTFLSSKPNFASPNPLAAGSGLTIPLQITLSDIRMSGFVILVFSKQKGITLVFRNDPLESLKVSSTFDSIPFVRDYLQRTIEGQLRVLFMEDLPAIIHRLSLRVFSDEVEVEKENEVIERTVDPFASPAQDASDGGEVSMISLDAQGGESYASFSPKNILRLAALTESQRTLSLFTPSIRDAVYRAWASTADRNPETRSDGATLPLYQRGNLPTLSRIQSSLNVNHANVHTPGCAAPSAWSSAASHTSEAPSHATRPSMASHSVSMPSTYTLSSSGRPRTRKRKNRVVNLRRNHDVDGNSDAVSFEGGSSYEESASASISASREGASSDPLRSPEDLSTAPTSTSIHREREGEVHTPQSSPRKKKVGFERRHRRSSTGDARPGAETSSPPLSAKPRPVTPRHLSAAAGEGEHDVDTDPTPRQSMYIPASSSQQHTQNNARPDPPTRQQTVPIHQSTQQKPPTLARSSSEVSISDLLPAYPFANENASGSGYSGGILEQAWMMKMATEIARRVAEERGKQQQQQGPWAKERVRDEDMGVDGEAPPAYGV